MVRFTGLTTRPTDPTIGSVGPEMMARIEHARTHITFGQAFKHLGLAWKSDETHQLSCPFHARYFDAAGQPVERNPSARYYGHDKRFWCFACNEGGDVVWFWRKASGRLVQNGLSLREAVGSLCKAFGLDDSDDTTAVLVQRRQERCRQLIDEGPSRAAILNLHSGKVNDLLWDLECSDPEMKESLWRVTEAIFERRFEIEHGDHYLTDLGRLLLEWQLWAIDMIERTWKIKHPVGR